MTTKIINPGRIDAYKNPYRNYTVPIFAKIEYNKGKLSISGVIGPRSSGNCAGSCGQFIMSFKEYDHRGYHSIDDIILATGWTRETLIKFFDLWDRWHLNDLKAGCEHQRAMGWDKVLLDDSKPKSHDNMAAWKYPESWKNKAARFLYDNNILWVHIPKQIKKKLKLFSLATKDTHPRGVLCKPCPVCGYKYGTSWKSEEVPQSVIDFLFALPDTTITPAWV